MKYVLSFFKFIFLLVVEIILFANTALLCLYSIIPHFVERNQLILPDTITKYIPQDFILDNLYDERFIFIIFLLFAFLLLISLLISQNQKTTAGLFFFPLLLFGLLLVNLNSFSNIVGIYISAEELFEFGIIRDELIKFSLNMGIKLLIAGALFVGIYIFYFYKMIEEIITKHEAELAEKAKKEEKIPLKIKKV